MNAALELILWKDVPAEVTKLAAAAMGPYAVISDLMPNLPDVVTHVWYAPYVEKAAFSYLPDTDSDAVAAWHIALKQVPGVESVEHGVFYTPSSAEPHIRIKRAVENKDIFGPISSAMQLKPNSFNNMFGGPNPLASTLAGGLLGAGAGYGAGWLAEQVLPEEYFERGKLRRTTGMLGGALGAAPGIAWGIDNMRAAPDHTSFGSWVSSYPVKTSSSRFTKIANGLSKYIPEEACELNEQWVKYADEAGASMLPKIPVDQFNRVIWNDLSSQGGSTPPQLAAATTGLMQAASLSAGTNMITPMDVARIGVGMGSGYVAGSMVGGVLGAMAGLKPEAQRSLQQAGTWAGILGNVVPIVFR